MPEKKDGVGGKPVSSFRLPAWLKEAVKKEAKATGLHDVDLVVALLGDYMRDLGYKSPQDELLERVHAKKRPSKKDETETSARVAGE